METGESIYSLLPRPQVPPEKPPMWRSKHAPDCGGKPARAAATMGPPRGTVADRPGDFLRSHAKEPVLPAPAAPATRKPKLKPDVPKRGDAPPAGMGLVSDRDWVTANAVDAILASPKRPPPEPPLWTERRGFGAVPAYLRRNRAAAAAEAQQLEAYLRLHEQPADQSTAVPMPDAERAELLRHLKLKWQALNAEYGRLGFVLDIGSKIARKERLEAQLAEVEGDIETLSRGDVVLVVAGDDDA